MSVGLKGYFFACQRAAKYMVEQKRGGSLICLSSVHAVNPCEQWTVYGSCKAALERMVKGLAVDLRGTGISANAIAPARATSCVIIGSLSDSGAHAVAGCIAQGAIANSLPSAEDRGKVDGPIDPNWGLTFDGVGAPQLDGLSVDCSRKFPGTENAVRWQGYRWAMKHPQLPQSAARTSALLSQTKALVPLRCVRCCTVERPRSIVAATRFRLLRGCVCAGYRCDSVVFMLRPGALCQRPDDTC